MLALRLGLAFPFAGLVALSLFWVMQYLIASSGRAFEDSESVHFVDFVRIEREEEVRRKERKPDKPPKLEPPPPAPPTPTLDPVNPTTERVAIARVPVQTSLALDASGFSLTPSDGEYLPIVKVQPVYPRRALSRNIEGYVIVEFTVTRAGTVRDVRVVESDPRGIFEKAAIKAAEKFKYKPRVLDGEPIEVPGVQNKISFKIAK